MSVALKKIAFICEEFGLGGPAQQLLDRFLVGYPRDGEFHRCGAEGHAYIPEAKAEADAALTRRAADFNLRRSQSIEAAVAEADGIVFVPRRVEAASLLASCLETARSGAGTFVCGALADDVEVARKLVSLAEARKIPLTAGTSPAVTWRLPDVDLPPAAEVKRALILVQGEAPLAELHALDGLLPLLERRKGGEAGVRNVQKLAGDDIWKPLNEPATHRLLAAALSRSDTPQGDPVRDGRTQDLLGLGLVPKLARDPRAWVIDHHDGVRSILLVLDGVVADFNFAVELAGGEVLSAQLYRPPAPQRHEFSRMAEVIERFFVSAAPPWPIARSLLTAELLATFAHAATR